jgi:amidase
MDAETIAYLSIPDLAKQLRDKQLSSVEVTRALLDRIHRLNPALHAYNAITDELALHAAEQADKEIRAGRSRGPLHGIPIAVKDLCWTKDAPTTCSSRVLRDWRPTTNATVVERFDAAGAVPLGKLNLTEFAVAWYHPELPAPINPWGKEFWPGASSSGSGVAAAAGLAYCAIGTDTGGSIRFPAAACGVVGLKPTWGRVSRYGVFPLGESFDHIGPLTRTVADAAIVLQAIAGHDPNDHTSLTAPVEDYAAAAAKGVAGAKGIRVALDEKFITGDASPEVATAVIEAVRTLERLGARIVKVSVPNTEECVAAWMTICTAETAAAHEATFPSRAADYGPGFRSFLELGAQVKGPDFAKAHMARERFANRFQSVFEDADVLACPSMSVSSLPATAMPADARELVGPNPLVRYTAPFNMSRNPTLSMPCGKSPLGPPPSLQLVGRRLGESILLQTGAAFEAGTEWHHQRPPKL